MYKRLFVLWLGKRWDEFDIFIDSHNVNITYFVTKMQKSLVT